MYNTPRLWAAVNPSAGASECVWPMRQSTIAVTTALTSILMSCECARSPSRAHPAGCNRDVLRTAAAMTTTTSSRQAKQALSVLLLVALLNYIVRFVFAGVLSQLQDEFDKSDTELGLVQTAFVVTFMFASPVFGYFGGGSADGMCG